MGRTGILPEISGITGFYELSCEHFETEYLRTAVGISDSDHPGTSSESDPESRDQKKIQLLIYAPNFISVIVLCGMVRMFLSPVGPLNKLIGSDANWMTMPAAFRTIYIASGIWQTAGWASIMYTAALANASKDLEEAAVVDGANILQQIWYVQLPAIKNIIVIQFILQAGNIMSIGFEKAYALQTDMNLPASEILSTYVYRIGLLNGDYGYSTAVGLFNSVINVILLIFVNWVVKKLNDGEGL